MHVRHISLSPLLYGLLVLGALNVVLRTSVESDITPFRVLAPFVLVMIVIGLLRVHVSTAALILLIIYGYAAGLAFGTPLRYLNTYLIHWAYVFSVVLIVRNLIIDHDSCRHFYRFLSACIIVIFLSLIPELLDQGFAYPNVRKFESARAAQSFFWTQNQLMICLVTYYVIFRHLQRSATTRWVFFLLLLSLCIYNDSKAALLGLVSVEALYLLGSIRGTLSRNAALYVVTLIVIFFAGVLSLYEFAGTSWTLNSVQSYTLKSLLADPILRIVHLEPTGYYWGSLNNRIDAIIYSIQGFVDSWFFGMGLGGAEYQLSKPQYLLGGASSTHNLVIQLIAEFGLIFVFFYGYVYFRAAHYLLLGSGNPEKRPAGILILVAPILGSSISGAFVTNYFLVTIVAYIFFFMDSRAARLDPPMLAPGARHLDRKRNVGDYRSTTV